METENSLRHLGIQSIGKKLVIFRIVSYQILASFKMRIGFSIILLSYSKKFFFSKNNVQKVKCVYFQYTIQQKLGIRDPLSWLTKVGFFYGKSFYFKANIAKKLSADIFLFIRRSLTNLVEFLTMNSFLVLMIGN